MHQSRTRDVGMAVHQESIAGADVATDHAAAVIFLGTFGPRQGDLDTRIRQLHAQAHPLGLVYEAGPCGDGLDRDLTNKDAGCWVGAPAFMPQQAGERVTTDRRDAMPRARRMRAGDLTPVDGPALDAAAIRDLRRARAETLRDRTAAQRRLQALGRRHHRRETGRATGRPAHLRWLSAVVGPTPAQQIVCQEDVQTVTAPTERLGRLALALPAPVQTGRFAPGGEALQALRGVPFTVAMTPGAALGDLRRVAHPRPLLHDLGLTPSAYASGGRRHQGGIPQPGTTPARRTRVEGAWADRDSGHRPSTPATAPGKAPHRDPRPQLEGPGPALEAVSPAHGSRPTGPSGRRRHGPPMQCRHGGHGHAGGRVTERLTRAVCGRPRARWPTVIGRDAAPVWCPPRRRDEAARYARPEMEAGTRRMPVRWDPPHGDPRDPPSCLTGSGSSASEPENI
jgi:transposase